MRRQKGRGRSNEFLATLTLPQDDAVYCLATTSFVGDVEWKDAGRMDTTDA